VAEASQPCPHFVPLLMMPFFLRRPWDSFKLVDTSMKRGVAPLLPQRPGIYWGFARIGDEGNVYKTACSIGYNPTYKNKTKTIEPHLIAPESDSRRHVSSCQETILKDFYDQTIRLSLVGYLRPELPFEGLDKLIDAIKNDIKNTEMLAGRKEDRNVIEEEAWVKSSDGI